MLIVGHEIFSWCDGMWFVSERHRPQRSPNFHHTAIVSDRSRYWCGYISHPWPESVWSIIQDDEHSPQKITSSQSDSRGSRSNDWTVTRQFSHHRDGFSATGKRGVQTNNRSSCRREWESIRIPDLLTRWCVAKKDKLYSLPVGDFIKRLHKTVALNSFALLRISTKRR